MSARPNKTEASSLNTTNDLSSAIEALAPDAANLAEGNAFSTAAPENPLQRRIVVSIRASLSELCLQKNKATWAPSQEALKSMFQQKKFTSLEGSADNQGDLKSIVLHKMQIDHSRSTFPVALGARITGVDDASFSSTGEAYSAIVLPHFVEPSIFLAGANTEQEKESQVETSDQYQDQDGNPSGTIIVAQNQGQH